MSLGNPDRPVGGLAVPRPAGVELAPLGRDDLHAAYGLVRELYGLPETDPETHRERFDRLVGDVDASPFLATHRGAPAGLVILRFRRRLNHATYEGWVSDLVVAEPQRGRGIGRTLMQAAIAEWRLRGGHRLVLEVGDQRAVARGLYESLGLRASGRHLELGRPEPRDRPAGHTLRGLSARDVDAVTSLLASAGRVAPAAERMAAVRRTFEASCRASAQRAWVAEREGELLGVCVAELREHFYVAAPQLWLSELAVANEARRRGIGRALLDRALAAGHEAGCYAAVAECPSPPSGGPGLLRDAGFHDVGASMELNA